jgi:predicted HicB family RNase H-like nuclease
MIKKMVLNIDDKAHENALKFAKKNGTTVEKLAIEFLRNKVKKAEVKAKRKAALK